MNENHYLARKIYRKETVTQVSKKLQLLGSTKENAVYNFLNLRFIGILVIFILLLFQSPLGFLIAPLASYLYYKGITYFLIDQKIKDRRIKLETEALTFFEILTLSLETGRNLQEALKVTISSSKGLLVDEFNKALVEVDYGKSLTESLEDLQKRLPSDAINNIILSLTEANINGNSIIKSLYSQLDYLREKRKLEIKAEISKVPIKISIISVFFFVPLVLIIILAPVLLSYLD